ncbi:MAG: LptF/LptG family permease [Bacteroidales bacterium]|nr:LptF/LptG family permease [Bacteroidales bacterium]
MIGIKILDKYILGKFLLIFVGAFFICLFVFMMQFTWRYVDELIGKGLSLEILAQFFWYMGQTLVPQALPLAVLLASLITFGNMGESLELLAMKAAGVSLMRVMRPMAFFALIITGLSFYFQNSISPQAQINLRTLLFSMKQQSPAVEIPEGVFYNGVPNINLYVEQKNAETGMLYQTIIYKTDQGFERAQIVLADSARLEMTSDKMHLKLDLWNGEQFEALQSTTGAQMMQSGVQQPYDRETFQYKQLLIDFDSNFNLMDKELLSGMPSAKTMRQIELSVDSMEHGLDSIGKQYYQEATRSYFRRPTLSTKDSTSLYQRLRQGKQMVDFDKMIAAAPSNKVETARHTAQSQVLSMKSDLEWKSMVTRDGDHNIRRHWVEWHQKMTLSLACIIFFFVGAPLGAIIRKGGLGMPTVISVIIFIFWYIINTSGMKLARDGSTNMVLGMWISTVVIAPFGIFISYKANRDSVVFNTDAYLNLLRRLLGIRTKRHIQRKEVIIEDPRMDVLPGLINELREACRAYNHSQQLLRLPNYINVFFRYRPDTQVEEINEQLEAIVEELSNSKDPKILGVLGEFPILYTSAHTSPLHSPRANAIAGVLLPLGLVLWFRIWRFRLRLLRDLRIIVRTCDRLDNVMLGVQDNSEGSGVEAEQMAENVKTRRRKRVVKVILLLFILALLGNVLWNGWQRYQRKARTETKNSEQQQNEAPVREIRFPARAPQLEQTKSPLKK